MGPRERQTPGGHERGEAVDEQRRVGLARRAEVVLHPEVHASGAELEPAAATAGEGRRLGDLDEAEHVGVERPGDRLTVARHGQLDVIDAPQARLGVVGCAHLY